jgi:hypothetical protein
VNSFAVAISDPGGITISDEITSSPITPPSVASIPSVTVAPTVDVTFVSDNESRPLGLCATPSLFRGCSLTETGAVQTAGTITWLGAGGATDTVRTDTIEFASNITDVPEPASWLLVLTGLPLGLRRLRRSPVGS